MYVGQVYQSFFVLLSIWIPCESSCPTLRIDVQLGFFPYCKMTSRLCLPFASFPEGEESPILYHLKHEVPLL